jgi:type VI secretion system protein ImpA
MMSAIDIEALLAEISPEAPSGETDLGGDAAFIDLEIKIEGTPEREFDGKIVQEAKDPNWNEIREDAVKLLIRGHDLRVAMFLTRALVHTDGLDGLGIGLSLLHGMIDRYWDSLYPLLDPEDDYDPMQRINILAALSWGQEILAPLKRSTLCVSPTLGRFDLRDILIASGKIDAPGSAETQPATMVDIEAAFKDCDVDYLLAKQTAIGAALNHLAALRTALNERIDASLLRGESDFEELQEVLTKMDAIMEKQLEGRQVQQPFDSNQTSQGNVAGDGMPVRTAASPMQKSDGVINGRQDVITLLDRICKYYQYNEPASPVPLLLKRARQLVEKNFIEIIQDLAPDSAGKINHLISGTEDPQ